MSKRDILKVFPTKERLVKFILAFYGLFSRKLGVTEENYNQQRTLLGFLVTIFKIYGSTNL